VNLTAVKLDGIQGGWCILPREALLHWNPNGAKDFIKPDREGEPEAGQGAKGGRFTGSTEEAGSMKKANPKRGRVQRVADSRVVPRKQGR
jgi:hypothetical protein